MRAIAIALTAGLFAGCGSSKPPSDKIDPRVTPRAAASPMAQARAFELGDAVARDYAAAAAIYAQQCASGSGRLDACRCLLQATVEGRGADVDLARAAELARAMCAHRDLVGCIGLVMSRSAVTDDLAATIKELIATPCDAQHLDRCEVARDPFSGFDQSSSAEYADRAFDARGCSLGVLDACERLKYDEGAEHDAAFVTLGKACDHGDAIACSTVDRPIDPTLLCAAHDYDACAALGCAGDATAAETASAHGVDAGCSRPARRRQLASARAIATGIVPAPRQRFDSVEFRRLDSHHGSRRSSYQIYNVGTRPIDLAFGAIYVYDDAGQQLARLAFEHRDPLAPGAGTTLELHGPSGASFEGCLDLIQFDGESAPGLARCPDAKPKGVRWGDGRDTVELRVDLSGIPLADGWVGTLEPTLAEPFEATHFGVRVRALDSSDVALWLASEPTTAAMLKEFTAAHGPALELPLVLEPTSIVYRLSGVDGLQLSPDTLAKIFARRIVTWDDPAIARDNPKRALPSIPIVVYQSSSRSDQWRLTQYLTKAAPRAWKLGVTSDAAFSADAAWIDARRKVPADKWTEGAITFVGPGIAESAQLAVAKLRNARGRFVAPTPESVSSGDYPLASSRSLFVAVTQPDQPTADAVSAYASWLLTDGLPIFDRLGYGRQPAAVTRAALARLGKLTVGVPDAGTSPPDAGTSGVAACDDYSRAFDNFLRCDKVPPQVKDASRQGFEAMKQGWAGLAGPDVPKEAKQAAAAACAQGLDALRQAANALGCGKI
jgi:ABC-type phosphate transport system substrate-binding protein/TPR repeat protein